MAKDYVEAVKWYRKAADQGVAGGQLNLGMCYLQGTGVPQDHVEAHKWLDLASSQDIVKARELMSTVKRQMTGEQIAEA